MNVLELAAVLTLNSAAYDKGLRRAEEDAGTAGSKITGTLVKAGKAAAVGISAVAGAVGVMSKSAVEAYASYEQLVGGVETLFKGTKAQTQVLADASAAYKDAGMSANAYMQTITGFAASLKQSTKTDLEAAQVGNMAVKDMSDNANKMGSDMESIQMAYQGFAKGQFQLLDNLKLGYGGTKTEMERLLKDAEEIHKRTTGEVTHYDMGNLSDIFTAVHEVQTELGITGTTEKEAAGTIEGSINAAKAAWENLLVGFADSEQDIGELSSTFVESLVTAGKNVVPRFLETFAGITRALPEIVSSAASGLGDVLSDGTFMESVAESLESGVAVLAEKGPVLLEGIKNGIIMGLESGTDFGVMIMEKLGSAFETGVPKLAESLLPAITSITGKLKEEAPRLVEAGGQMLLGLAQGFADSLPVLIENIPQIVINISDIINENAPKLLEIGFNILKILAQGIIESLPVLAANIPKIVEAIFKAFAAISWAKLGKTAITGIASGIKAGAGAAKTAARTTAKNAISAVKAGFSHARSTGASMVKALANAIRSGASSVASAARKLATGAINKVKDILNGGADIGRNLVRGLWAGLSGSLGWIKGMISGWVGNVKSFLKSLFGIHSPSTWARDVLGVNLVKGFAAGIDANGDMIDAAVHSLIPDGTFDMGVEMNKAGKAKFEQKNVSVNNTFHVDGTKDPDAYARELAKTLKREIRMV